MVELKPSKIPIISLAVIGDTLSGKTCMIKKFLNEYFGNKDQTIAPNMNLLDIIIPANKVHFKVKLWDVSGQKRFGHLTLDIIKNAQGIIIVYDTTNKDSYLKINKYIDKIKYFHNIETFPFAIVGNKTDLEDKRKVLDEDLIDLIENNDKIKFFETSAISGKGIKEIFSFLLISSYSHHYANDLFNENRRYDITINENIKLSQISIKSHDSFSLFDSLEFLHEEELSTSGLKSLLSKIETDNFFQLISEIEDYLKRMKPTKCDINYQKYFVLLFRKIKAIQNKELMNMTYVNCYTQLTYIFYDIYPFLQSYNKNNEVLQLIHSISSIKHRFYYYQLYTNNFTTFDQHSSKDLIKMYNCFFCHFLHTSKTFFHFSNEFSNIVIILFGQLKEIKDNHIEIGRGNESPYIIQVIESFGDIFLFILIKTFLFQLNIKKEQICDIIIKIFPFFFEMQREFNTVNLDLIVKIMCVFCILYDYYEQHNKIEEKQMIIDLITVNCQENSSICLSSLFEILMSLNHTDNENILVRKLKNKLYLPYFNIVLDNELNSDRRTDLINKSFLKQYDYYMEKVISNTAIYKGCFLILNRMYQINIYFDDIKYPPFIIIRELYSYFLNIKVPKNQKYHLWKQLSDFICTFVIAKYKHFTKDEWVITFQLLSNSIVFNVFDNDSFLQVFECFSQNFKKLKTNQIIIKSINNFKQNLEINQKTVKYELNTVLLSLVNDNM